MIAMPYQLVPSPDQIADDALYRDLALPEGPDWRPFVAMNMVSSVDGKAVLRGRAKGIGSPLDRTVMLRLRSAVDMVLAGAGTIRAGEGDLSIPGELVASRRARGWSPQPRFATVSAQLDLPLKSPFFRLGSGRPLVFTSAGAPLERQRAIGDVGEVVVAGTEDVDVAQVLHYCRQTLGVRRVLLEGGPRLNQEFLDREVVDELFWTVAPKLYGGAGQRTIVEGPMPRHVPLARLHLRSAYLADDELFLRYEVEGCHGST
ncbi:MAG: dihydrofolate reductase family protein [Chloroflexi bacterium]|nr:dihydrofolate reductase family protein [Chloroflexota bacterium]